MAATPSDDDTTTCPPCHVTLAGDELQLHYLQSCAGYDDNGNYIYLHIYRIVQILAG